MQETGITIFSFAPVEGQAELQGYLSYSPHPLDWSLEGLNWPAMVKFITAREEEIERMCDLLGTADHWSGILEVENSSAEIRLIDTRVCDFGSGAVAWLGFPDDDDADMDVLIVIPCNRLGASPSECGQRLACCREARDMIESLRCASAPYTKFGHAAFYWEKSPPDSERSDILADIRISMMRSILRWLAARDLAASGTHAQMADVPA